MKLATLKNGSRDGRLIIVDKSLSRFAPASAYPTLQNALDEWHTACAALSAEYEKLQSGEVAGEQLSREDLAAPLPRAYQWLDGSAYLNHVELVRRARGAEMPPEFFTDPLMYQGGSDTMLGCSDDILFADEKYGVDLEAEVVVVTDDVPRGCPAEEAGQHIALVGICNDVSLRNLIPAELKKGFGFMQGKPPTAFSPAFVTPDELGGAWRDCKIHLPLNVSINGERFGAPECGEDMQFSFARLLAHAAKTRPLGAGTILGSGTISNRDSSRGFCCIAEVRMIETIKDGKPKTEFLKDGDRVKIEMLDKDGAGIFGAIEQRFVRG